MTRNQLIGEIVGGVIGGFAAVGIGAALLMLWDWLAEREARRAR